MYIPVVCHEDFEVGGRQEFEQNKETPKIITTSQCDNDNDPTKIEQKQETKYKATDEKMRITWARHVWLIEDTRDPLDKHGMGKKITSKTGHKKPSNKHEK